MRLLSWPLLAVLLFLIGHVQAQPGYYREPALHGDALVFVAEGDLWRVHVDGGQAQRLTTHAALESQPVLSADGRQLAFIASYDGAPDAYIMPLQGGEPRRLSFDGGRAWLAGFSPQGELVQASEHVVGPSMSRILRLIDPSSGKVTELPLADAREIAFDPQSDSVWFTRFGLAVSGDNAHGYRGGAMAQLWRWQRERNSEATRLAQDMNANISQPMWWQGRLYVVSDADGRDNIWSMDAAGGDHRQLTFHKTFDVRGARLDEGRIVYQLGADLHVHDLAAASDRTLDITLGSDFVQRRERFIDEPVKWLASAHIDASGERVALAARGQAILAGTQALRRIELAVPRNARARAAAASADGKAVYAITDIDGRSEIWRYAADGSPQPKVLVPDEDTHRWRLWPSPDGRWLAHSDKRARLWLLDLRGGANHLLDESPHGGDDAYDDLAWSTDGRYLAWSRPDSERQMAQLLLAEVSSRRKQVLTSDRYESFHPAFSPDGQWLYFLSDRSFSPTPGSPWGDRNTGALFDQRTRIYALALQEGLRFPFQPLDELTAAGEKPDDAGKDGPHKALPQIAFDGLAQRLFEVGLAAGNYSRLQVHAERLYFLRRNAGADAKATLQTLAIKPGNDEAQVFRANVRRYELNAARDRLMVVTDPWRDDPADVLLLDASAKAPSNIEKERLRLDDWKLVIDPAQEWRQMFDDAWRMHRQFSFDPSMRGVDWDGVRERYLPLLTRVHDRLELDDLLGQMSAELGILHSQVRGGEFREDPAAQAPASLGARLVAADGGMRVEHIYRTDPELPAERAPLQQPGVDVREGDLITAINGRPLRSAGDLARALRAQAGEQVLVDLRRGKQELRAIVRPVTLERDAVLRYGDWVRGNLAKVEQAGGGRIGYLHLRAMGPGDMANFVREFYAQFDRDGLVIDVRRNRGGNIDSWVIEKLLRRAWAFWQPAHGAPYSNMQQAFRGHLVVLADEFSYSDGETFAAGVKALQLGPVIGQRTAGAGIWLSDRNRLSDHGLARIAETGQFDLQGRWLIEGQGVEPDISVENLPWATALGGDAQLDAALAHLQRNLRDAPPQPLRARPIPPVGVAGHDATP